jgi:hypothetical protein
MPIFLTNILNQKVMQIWLPSLTLVLVYFSGLLLKSFWPKYFEQKATNQATKEDIGNITDIVESIKSDLQKEVEQLKAQISLANQHKLNLKAFEREAILEYTGKLNAYIYYLVELDMTIYDDQNYGDLLKERVEINRKSYEFAVAEANLGLFLDDVVFITKNMELKLSISTYERKVVATMLNITHKYKMCELEISAKPEKALEIKEKFYKEAPAILSKYHEEQAPVFAQIVVQNNLLRNFLRTKKDHIQE